MSRKRNASCLAMFQEKDARNRLWKWSILAISWERQASELWGIDISEKQIEKAKQHLTACGLSANLIRSPMEEECGIPEDYFDFVYSIYAIGWTTDLESTFSRIASYLKKTASLSSVGLILYINVLLKKIIDLF